MFRPKSQQPSSDDLYAFLPEVKRAQLENSWAGTFRREILPMLWEVETDFADLYHPGMGSPNKPVAEILGMLILKDFHDYTDEQTLEAVRFNMQWQYALQLGHEHSILGTQITLDFLRDRQDWVCGCKGLQGVFCTTVVIGVVVACITITKRTFQAAVR